MTLDMNKIPFSRRGSYFVISMDRKSGGLYIRDIHGGDESPSNLYQICFPHDLQSELMICAVESKLTISRKDGSGCAEFVFGKEDTLHIRLRGIYMELRGTNAGYDSLVPYGANRWEHILYSKERKIMCTCVQGQVQMLGSWEITSTKDAGFAADGGSEEVYLVLHNYRTVYKDTTYESFETVHKEVMQDYDSFRSLILSGINLEIRAVDYRDINKQYTEQAELAAYLLWANFVKADGILPYDALYCSKNWMYNIWSWDNCFTAMALAKTYPKQSYEQIAMFFGFQDTSGCYPDYINDRFASYSCCKPAIHVWAYEKMRKQNPYFEERDRYMKAYESFTRLTEYYLSRRKDSDSLPVYTHGNDSGWDNASVFHGGVPVESPDLTAYLIRQLDLLSLMAERLGYETDASRHKDLADELYQILMNRLYDGKRFYAIHQPDGKAVTEGDSLLMYLPIVIGYRLEKDVMERLVSDLLEKFEAAYGLCTENPKGSFYKSGGYWLGPIWAPVTYIIIDALRENGYDAFAERLAKKFCNLTKIGDMAENYDPFTGEGYDDPAFSWSSAVLLLLLNEYPDIKETEYV